MGGIFNMDGPFFKFGNIVADIMILSLFWIIFSIPLITIGASTTAIFYVTTRRISDREGYLFKDFLSSFKSNFKRSTLLWLLWVFMFVLIAFNINILRFSDFDTTLTTILFPLQILILIELVITMIYIFPLTARFDMGFKQTIKSAFFMANRHIFTTLSALSAAVMILMLTVFVFEPIIFVGMGIYAYLTSFMVMRIFKKYRPDLDAEDLSALDLAPLPDDIFGDGKEAEKEVQAEKEVEKNVEEEIEEGLFSENDSNAVGGEDV